MTLITFTVVTLVAAVFNGIAVAALIRSSKLTDEPAPSLAPVHPTLAGGGRRLETMLCTVVEPRPRYAAPVRRGAPALCWGEVGIYADQQAAQLFHKVRQA